MGVATTTAAAATCLRCTPASSVGGMRWYPRRYHATPKTPDVPGPAERIFAFRLGSKRSWRCNPMGNDRSIPGVLLPLLVLHYSPTSYRAIDVASLLLIPLFSFTGLSPPSMRRTWIVSSFYFFYLNDDFMDRPWWCWYFCRLTNFLVQFCTLANDPNQGQISPTQIETEFRVLQGLLFWLGPGLSNLIQNLIKFVKFLKIFLFYLTRRFLDSDLKFWAKGFEFFGFQFFTHESQVQVPKTNEFPE